jgi:hypothetical protein
LLKADVENAKQNFNVDNLDDPVENQLENEVPQQPDWMKLIKPNPNYEAIDESNFKYDDGGPEYDWGLTSHHYPSDLGINWLSNLILTLILMIQILTFLMLILLK